MVILTYLNHRKAVLTWIEQIDVLPERFYGLPTTGMFLFSRGFLGWFELIYISVGVAVFYLLTVHSETPIYLLTNSWMGKGQQLYIVFMWWIIAFNFERALPRFSPERIVTEGTIIFNGIVATVLCLVATIQLPTVITNTKMLTEASYLLAFGYGFAILVMSSLLFWAITLVLFAQAPIPHSGLHIRFGPNRTVSKKKPKAGQNHP